MSKFYMENHKILMKEIKELNNKELLMDRKTQYC